MSECNHDCSNCSENCESRDFRIYPCEGTSFKKIFGIVSGKGGVGKSFVSSLLAVSSAKLGFKTSIIDGDILGPSIPKMFGVNELAYGNKDGTRIYPNKAPLNIDMISSQMLLEDPTDPVIWRSSIVTSILKQFYTDVLFEKQDVLFIDMPPGTGDVPLTIFQSIPLDGIIIVTSPQDLVSMIVTKAIKMAGMMNIPILGIVENYSYVTCPKCQEKISLFGNSKADELALEYNIPNVIKLPLDASFAKACDDGEIYNLDVHFFDEFVKKIMD